MTGEAREPVSSPAVGRFAGWHLGAALGLRTAVAPAIVYVPLGYLLGPRALALLSTSALGHLDLFVWLALTLLGVFAGIGLDLRTRLDRELLLVASTEAALTAGIVAGAMAWLAARWGLPLANSVAPVALVAGLCAAASAVVAPDGRADSTAGRAARIADLDDLIVIVLGAGALWWHPQAGAASAIGTAAAAVPLGIMLASAGLLLFERARSDAERGTFVLGVLTLLAGTAAYLSLSPLLIGLVAGLVWRWMPGRADEVIRADLSKLHHPLVVLLLIIAGAYVVPSRLVIWLVAPFVAFRLTGKLMGGWAGARMFPGTTPLDLGARLLPSGLIGIALALHFNQLAGGTLGPAVVSMVALGAIAFEAMTLAALAGEPR